MTDNERLFRIIWPERCWHSVSSEWTLICDICKEWAGDMNPNPDFAHSDEIAQAMMEKGLWDEFVEHLMRKCIKPDMSKTFRKFAGIIADPIKLKQAIIAWAALRTLGHDELAKEVGGCL